MTISEQQWQAGHAVGQLWPTVTQHPPSCAPRVSTTLKTVLDSGILNYAYRISSNRSRALNTSRASNTDRGLT